MQVEKVSIDSVLLDPANVRQHPQRNIDAIRSSLARFGQQKPIVVDGDGIVRAGNGTLEAARQLGWSEIDVVRTPLRGAEAAAFAIADNRTSDLSEFDYAALDKQVHALLEDAEAKIELADIGFTEAEMAALLKSSADLVTEGLDAEEVEDLKPEPLPAEARRVYTIDQISGAAIEHFRKHGFPYPRVPVFLAMQMINRMAALSDETLKLSKVGYRIADTYQPGRFSVYCKGAHYTPAEVYAVKNEKLFRRSFLYVVEKHGATITGEYSSPLVMFHSGAQGASNFRPCFMLYILRRFLPAGGKVLDTSHGYGGRCVGFIASEGSQYVGIDPEPATSQGVAAMVRDLGQEHRVKLIQKPAECVTVEEVGAESCDLAFTSPPYFTKEEYGDSEDQSHRKFPTFDGWVSGFLRPMMALQFAALKPGCLSMVNIQDVKVGSDIFPCVNATREAAAACGFVEEASTLTFPLPAALNDVMVARKSEEPILTFRKPGGQA